MKLNTYLQSVICLAFACLATAHAVSQTASAVNQQQAAEAYGKLPLSFEANQGQSDSQVKFLSRGSGYSLFLTRNEAVLALKKPGKKASPGLHFAPARDSHLQPASLATRRPEPQSEAVLRMRLVGENATAQVTGLEELPGRSNYFIGTDPSKWRTGVPNYTKVKYANVYPGVDLVYYGNQRQLEFDLVIQPGADPQPIRLDFRAALNGKHAALRVNNKGDLVVGEVIFHKPLVYQPTTNDETPATHKGMIDCKFVLTGAHQVRFQIAAYDRSRPLVIDPTLVYSTYLGGSDVEFAGDIAVDASGNAYVIGGTQSSDFPTTSGAFQKTLNGFGDVFISKFNAAGSALLYSTYLGGDSGFESGSGIAVDISGNAYVTGSTESSNFPTTAGAFQTTYSGAGDVFVSKLNATGSALLYSTYLGGNDTDVGSDIAVDASGHAYVTGNTVSLNFPITPGAFQTTFGGTAFFGGDVFVSKLNAAGSALVYSTYLGGSGDEFGNRIAVDASGHAYVTGATASTNFPTTPGAFQTTFGGGTFVGDGFVSKLNAAGSALLYSTYLGGSNDDFGTGILVDGSTNAYVTGSTASTNFPTTPGSFQTTLKGPEDAFVSKLNATGSALLYSTYLGGSDFDTGGTIAVDTSGNAYVTGQTISADFPITPGAFQTTLGFADAFVSRLNATGSALLYSTYLGGSRFDAGGGIPLDASRNAYVLGITNSPDFPTTPGAFQTTFGGGNFDAFVSKFSFGIPFCNLRSKLELDADGDRDDGFELNAGFALGAGGRINPATQPVTLVIGSYAVTIPAGSFVKSGESYEFGGVINGVRLAVLIRPNDDDKNHDRCTQAKYTVMAKGSGSILRGTTNPVTVTISIDDNTGTTKVNADFER
jgi:hypothetical protein